MNITLHNNTLSHTTHEIVLQNDTLTITPDRDSRITLYITNHFPDFHAQNIIVNFLSSGAEVNIFGLYEMQAQQQLKLKTFMNHHVPHCKSTQTWRGVLSDQAKVDFEGLIDVKPKAQKTIAHLSNKNLLLSDTAEVMTKPFLEINTDDVQCTHGATVGFLDQAALFYLRSRGVVESEAKQMLIEAFIACVLPQEVTPC